MLKAVATGMALCLALAGSPALGRQLSPKTEAAIDTAMQGAVDSGSIAGGVVAVTQGGKLVFARGYGLANLETGTRATPDTVFRIGSLTKQFTAAAVLLLAEDGKLKIDDPVRDYLPQFPRDDATTIRQLLTHTSGIVDFVGRPGFDRETLLPHTTDQLVAYVLSSAPLHAFEPGAQWAYSSSNYVLLGAIVERVSGMPLGQFLKVRIFDRLGMSSTALDSDEAVVLHRAAGYDRTPRGFANTGQISMTVPFAAGGMRSTAGDLLRWANALTHGRVMSAASYQMMTTPVRLRDGRLPVQTLPDKTTHTVTYGMGLFLSGDLQHPDIGHGGAINGFTSHLGVFAQPDIAAAVLLNTSPNEQLPIPKVTEALTLEVQSSGAR